MMHDCLENQSQRSFLLRFSALQNTGTFSGTSWPCTIIFKTTSPANSNFSPSRRTVSRTYFTSWPTCLPMGQGPGICFGLHTGTRSTLPSGPGNKGFGFHNASRASQLGCWFRRPASGPATAPVSYAAAHRAQRRGRPKARTLAALGAASKPAGRHPYITGRPANDTRRPSIP